MLQKNFPAQIEDDTILSDEMLANFEGDSTLQKILSSLPQKSTYNSSQRPILIEGATNIEIDKFVYALENPVVYKILNYIYIAGNYKNYPVIVARTEQGMENSAVVTALAIEIFNPVAVINQGMAGGESFDAKVNSIVIGKKFLNGSAYGTANTAEGAGIQITSQEMRGTFAYDNDTKTFQLQQEYFADSTLLKVAEEIAASNKNFVTLMGTIFSANSWFQGVDHLKFNHEKYGSLCEEMEGCAAAQICKSSNVPFIGIRAISNNSITAQIFYQDAAITSQDFVLLVVEKYINEVLIVKS